MKPAIDSGPPRSKPRSGKQDIERVRKTIKLIVSNNYLFILEAVKK